MNVPKDRFAHRVETPDRGSFPDQMKLGINATFLNDSPTGIGVYTKEVSTRLCALNVETRVFTPVSWNALDQSSVHKTPPSARGSFRFFPNLLRFLYVNTVLSFLARHPGLEVLYCPILEFPFVPRVPLVVTVHDLHPIYFPRQFGLAAKHFRFSLDLLPKVARRIIVPSEFVKGELLKVIRIDSDSVDVVPNGYNAELFKPADGERKEEFLQRYGIPGRFILFVGSHFPYKNIKSLIKAFNEIKDRISHSLVLVGKKELSSGPLQQDERISYLDYVPNDELPKFYSFADALVHPSLAEGFGMTVLEAMACGTPVISSNRGSLPEVMGDAGILFDPDDEASLAGSILRVLNERGLREELVKKGLNHVKKYSWDRTAEGVFRSCGRALGDGA